MRTKKKAAKTAANSLKHRSKGTEFCAHTQPFDAFLQEFRLKSERRCTVMTQYETIYRTFMRPMTMLEASDLTGILRANICRYKRAMEKDGLIQLIYKARDRRTGAMAGYYSSNRSLWPTQRQQLSFDFGKEGSDGR